MEPIEILLGIIALILTIVIAVTPYFWKKYFVGPELTIELIPDGGTSKSSGLSLKNDSSKPIPIDEAIYIFEVEWKINLRIINNSDLTAYYPQIRFLDNQIGFTSIEKLNKNMPIEPNGQRTLKASFKMYEECRGAVRTHIHNKLPEQLKDFKILLEYKNPSKVTFHTLYNNSEIIEQNKYCRKKPKEFRNNNNR